MRYLHELKRQFVLAHASGIPVRADYRWIFVILLMTLIIAASLNQFTESGLTSVALGLVTTVVFFLSIFVHEFAHAVIARMERVEVVEIILHPFGGMTRFHHEPKTPRAEFRIAIAGPVASFLLAVFFVVLATIATSAEANTLVLVTGSLAILNFLIAVFNMFPGYPLDGGRVLRAYLWRSGKDLDEATVLTGRCGQAIAIILIAFGLLLAIFRQEFFTGFWMVLVGLFLFDSAKGIIEEVRMLRNVPVESAMMLAIQIAPESSIQEFVENVLPMYRQPVFPVARNRQLYGMLLLEEMKAIHNSRWHATRIVDVMRPVESDHFVETGTALSAAQEIASANGIGAVAVIDASANLVGVLHARTKKPRERV
jgi:Zn-dependent protease